MQKPVPQPTPLSEPFWSACNEGRLTVQRCNSCGGYSFPPQEFCRHCFGEDLSWVETAGRGTVYSFSVVRRPQTAAFDVPYTVAIVRLNEGFEMMTNLVGFGERPRFGQRVVVDFERRSAAISLPVFRPDPSEELS